MNKSFYQGVGILALGLGILSSAVAQTATPGLLSAWGLTNSLTTNLPALPTGAAAIAAGGFHAVALKADGSISVWGDNSEGQTNLPPTATNVMAIAAGAKHTVVLRSNHTVVAWGLNLNNQTNVPASLNGVQAVAAGAEHSVALRTNGTVVAWGGAAGWTNIPVSATSIVAIAAGAAGTVALRSNGTIVAWGIGTLTNTLPASATNVLALSVGQNHALALRADGTVVAWGDNTFGQTNVPANLTNIAAVSAGWLHSLALRSNGTMIAWGLFNSGQTNIPASLTNISAIAAGNAFNLALDLAVRFTTRPPTNLVLSPGQNTNLVAEVQSSSPLRLQWALNGQPLAAATNNTYALTAFTADQAGTYQLFASNAVTSASVSTIVRLSNAPSILVNNVPAGGGSLTRTNFASITLTPATNTYANIYYTLDGSPPNFTATPYSGAIVTSNTVTVRAIAYNPLFTDSAATPPVLVQVIPTYALTVSAPGGSVDISPAANLSPNLYLSNTVVTLTATASNGWSFERWSGDVTALTPQLSVTMDQARTVRAVFATTLNLFTNGPGQLLLDPPGGRYEYGSNVTLTALPGAGSYFFGWAGFVTGFTNPLRLTVTNASGLTALFGNLLSNQVSLLALPVNGGLVTVSPAANVYTNGATVHLSASPTAARVFSHWSGDATGNSNPLPVLLDSSKVIYANFIAGTPTNGLVFTATPGGRTLSPGTSTILSASVAGDGPIAYQWLYNGAALAGATNSSLTLTSVTPAWAGRYSVIATNSLGAITSPSAPVALFTLELVPGGTGAWPLLVMDCAPGQTFRLEYAPDPTTTNWQLLRPITLRAARDYFVDSAPTNPTRFYRLQPD